MRRLEDRIFESLRVEGSAAGEIELARKFLGVGDSGIQAAARIIATALGRDPRFVKTESGWTARSDRATCRALREEAWLVLTGWTVTREGRKWRVLAMTGYRPDPDGSCACALYLVGAGETAVRVVKALEEETGLRFAPLSELKLLRLLEEAWQQAGILLRGLAADGLGWLLQLAEATGTGWPEHVYSMTDLLRLVLPAPAAPRMEEARRYFHLETSREDPFLAEVEALPALLPALIEALEVQGVERVDELSDRVDLLRRPLDLGPYDFTGADLAALPEKPGVYLFYDAAGTVLYVGKSVNLRRRVGGYFRWQADADQKLQRIQSETRRWSIQVLGSDLEALLEEARLIRTHHPAINVQLESHELPAEKGLADVLLALLPHASEGMARLFALNPRGSIRRLAVDRLAPDLRELERFLEETCATTAGGDGAGGEDFSLALRWLRKNSDRLTFFKYHDYPDRPGVVRAILAALPATPGTEKIVIV